MPFLVMVRKLLHAPKMQDKGISPDVMFVRVLEACSDTSSLEIAIWIHNASN